MNHVKKILLLLLLLGVLLPQKAAGQEKIAEEISSAALVTESTLHKSPKWLFDGNVSFYQKCPAGTDLTLEQEGGMGSLYLLFNVSHEPFLIRSNDGGEEAVCGEENFLHEFVDLQELFGYCPRSLTITLGEKEEELSELRVFTEGEPPKDVQRWKTAPEDGVDLLVFPTHGDDEQLFFAGLLPYYAGEKGYEVQVVYSTDHHNYGTVRPHEMLDGLWAVGVKNYPVFGPYRDIFSKTEHNALLSIEQDGYGEDQIRGFVVEQIRRFRPLVVVGHDFEGEYGHGFHRLFGRMAAEASDIAGDPEAYIESAETYGTWDVPKTYIHLYEENPIHMNWDIPLDAFGGMTAYEVTKTYGFPAHKSQYSGFAFYFAGHDTAEEVTENCPCDYGLYRSTVGPDREGKDLFENLTCRRELKEQEEEKRQAELLEQQRMEEEKKQKEQEAQALAERQENLKKEELAAKALQESRQQRKRIMGAGLTALVLLTGIVLFAVLKKKK